MSVGRIQNNYQNIMNILSFKSMYLRWAKVFEVNGSFCNPPLGPERSSYLGRYMRAGFSAWLSPLLSAPQHFVVDSCLLDSHCCHREARYHRILESLLLPSFPPQFTAGLVWRSKGVDKTHLSVFPPSANRVLCWDPTGEVRWTTLSGQGRGVENSWKNLRHKPPVQEQKADIQIIFI